MPTYLVEEMNNNRVIRSRVIEAPTPFLAASKLIDRKVGSSTKWEKEWIRVTDEMRGQVFAYSFSDEASPPQHKPIAARG